MSVTVFLSKAIICFSGMCYPALLGKDTTPGEYQIQQRHVLSPGYGGDVLQYDETPHIVYAIHRVWTGRPSQRRLERLESDDPAVRRFVTNGCINVHPEVYDALVECCSNSKLKIEE